MSTTLLLTILVVIAVEQTLAMYVALRAWRYRTARLFVLSVIALMIISVGSLTRYNASNQQTASYGIAAVSLGLCLLSLTLIWLFSALFVPAWWRGRPAVIWISLPYVAALSVLSLDLIGGFGFFIDRIEKIGGAYRAIITVPTGQVLLIVFSLGWMVHFSILVNTFIRQERNRPVILVLIGALIWSATSGWVAALWEPSRFISATGLVQTLPFISALAYAVLQGRVFEPTQAAVDLALQGMIEALAVLDTDDVVVYANPQAARLGLRPGCRLADGLLRAGALPDDVVQLVLQHVAVEHPSLMQTMQLGVERHVYKISLTPVTDVRGRAHGSMLLARDVTDLERHAQLLERERTRLADAVQQLSHLAKHDPLTGLPNRRSLGDALERVVADASSGYQSILLFVDLDNFKLVNDTLGHTIGDEVLVTLSQLLAAQLRPNDILCRLGGDEFAVLLDRLSVDEGWAVAEQLRDAVDSFRFTLDGRSFHLSLSIGLVVLDGQDDAQLALTQADIAMYAAKEQGRNRVMLYKAENESFMQLSDANQWITRIKDAMRDDRLQLHFQPVVRLDTKQVAYYEALLRMCNEHGELVPPAAFIGAAERFGLMPQLDRWIVRQAVDTLKQHPHTCVFVNLSARSLADEALLSNIEALIRTSGIEAGRLGFEITETAAVQDMLRAERWIRQLKTFGCRFALDDFGVGFTSFAYLRNLPVDHIKIDGSFIRDLDRDHSNRAIVQAIHTLAEALGKTTIAEYVEQPAVMAILKEIGIMYGQGFYLGPPLPTLLKEPLAQYKILDARPATP